MAEQETDKDRLNLIMTVNAKLYAAECTRCLHTNKEGTRLGVG